MEKTTTAFGWNTGLPKSPGFSRTPPRGARVNDLSGNVPSNQIWAQAYNQASKQYGGNTQAQSWTMPGSFSSRSFNPATGAYGKPTGGQSWDGNLAYSAIDSRPGPVQASATGVGGRPMQWQDAMRQREAFAGNLVQRLGQYNTGQLKGPVTFDTQQLLSQADDQLAKGTFVNPFAAAPTPAVPPPAAPTPAPQTAPATGYRPEVQRAMDTAAQFINGNFQNPFGNSPAANTPRPSWPTIGQAQPIAPQDTGTRYGWGDVVQRPVIPQEPPEQRAAREAMHSAGFRAGWKREIHGPGWMSDSGQYWDGSGPAPWM